jgi:hypothetical protein
MEPGVTIAGVIPTRPPILTAALHARTAAYDIVLLAHVLAALVALVVVVVAGGSALALVRAGSATDALRRYYRPGTNWAGRILFLVPLLGFALIAMSGGDWSYSDDWVAIGLAVWVVAALVGELVLWPAEGRLRAGVERGERGPALSADCRRAAGASLAIGVLLLAATVVMVAKP